MEYALFVIFGVILILIFLLVSFMKWDIWPFSHYPMFSKYRSDDTIGILRLALVMEDGKKHWWSPTYQHLQRDYPTTFMQLINDDCDLKSKIEACHFVAEAGGHTSKNIEIIEVYNRFINVNESTTVEDKVVLRVSLKELLSQVNAA